MDQSFRQRLNALPIRERRRLVVLLAAVIAVPAIVVIAVGITGLPGAWSKWGLGLLMSAAAMMSGALVGFLFGIPRSAQGEHPSQLGAGRTAQGRLLVNTNLEQISDWLTKILVGVGLIQLSKILGAARGLIDATAGAFAAGPAGRVIVGALVLFWSVAGFLAGYVVTRTRLTEFFARFDAAEIRSIVDAQVTERLQRDGDAMRLVLQQVDDDAPAVDFTALRDALAHASPGGRANILVLSEEIRRKTWRHQDTKPQLTRTAPVFRALTEVSPDSHRYWANLGFALKDQELPDYAGAKYALDQAIQLRGDPSTSGSEAYEFARALVRVRNLAGTNPDEQTRLLLMNDAQVAWTNRQLRRRIKRALDTRPADADAADREIQLLRPFLPEADDG
jgi:hypothetical protein